MVSLGLGFEKIVLKKGLLLAFIKDFDNDTQKNNLQKLFKYSSKNDSSISFSQKKTAEGDRFVVKLVDIDSISYAIKILMNIKN